MKKVLATILKEWILTRRDVAGFMLLFLMPAVLIVVMAMVQDAPFKDYQELKFELLLVDNDGGSLAKEIKKGLKESKNFKVIDSVDGAPLSKERFTQLLQDGEYKVGIVIPKGATAEVVNAANIVANSISSKLGLMSLPTRDSRDSSYVRMYFDPVTKPTFRLSISNALDKFVTYSCSNMLVQRLSKLGKAEDIEQTVTDDFKKVFSGIGIREEMLYESKEESKYINSVQHNVPAWAIFGMFFIVIPIAGHSIREREEGSALRVGLIPFALRYVALGKILFYTLICTLQFIFMFSLGIWLLPLLGLPTLYLGINAWVLLPVAIAIAFAATSYGHFIGAVFKTTNQSMPFGAISIVILSAIGGIWVPVDLLPESIQTLALISPLRWGLDAVNAIILRNGDFTDVLLHLMILFSFSIVLWLISIYKHKTRPTSVQ
ncbi:MAG: ABC transporter permease [Flavipsychrobacter sp.]